MDAIRCRFRRDRRARRRVRHVSFRRCSHPRRMGVDDPAPGSTRRALAVRLKGTDRRRRHPAIRRNQLRGRAIRRTRPDAAERFEGRRNTDHRRRLSVFRKRRRRQSPDSRRASGWRRRIRRSSARCPLGLRRLGLYADGRRRGSRCGANRPAGADRRRSHCAGSLRTCESRLLLCPAFRRSSFGQLDAPPRRPSRRSQSCRDISRRSRPRPALHHFHDLRRRSAQRSHSLDGARPLRDGARRNAHPRTGRTERGRARPGRFRPHDYHLVGHPCRLRHLRSVDRSHDLRRVDLLWTDRRRRHRLAKKNARYAASLSNAPLSGHAARLPRLRRGPGVQYIADGTCRIDRRTRADRRRAPRLFLLPEKKMKDRVAVVTGGGTGIGRAISEQFARAGAKVVVNYSRSRQDSEDAVKSIQSKGGAAIAVGADISKQSEANALMDAAVREFGRLDYLINNAGWSQRVPHAQFDDLTDEIWDRVFDTNLRGAFYCVRAATPHLKKHQGAAIVNIASVAALMGQGSSMAYAASKGGMVTLTKSLARALAPDIRVNAVLPGFIRTRFAGWPDSAFDDAEKITPLRKLATVDDVAMATIFFAGWAMGTTGETLVVDGGMAPLGPALG